MILVNEVCLSERLVLVQKQLFELVGRTV